jgi:hypothetical protein
MRSRARKLLPLLLLPVVAISSMAADSREGRRNRNRDAEGFEFIFNGVDLRGWKGDTNFWSVQGSNIIGRITVERSPKANTFLIWTNGTVGDFELRAAFKITPNNPNNPANSGIQYRSRELTNEITPFVVAGYRADIDAANLHTGSIHEERGRSTLAARGQMTRIGSTGTVHPVGSVGSADEIASVIRKNDWNEYAIIARGNQITHLINGRVTAQATDTQEGARSFHGVVALQLHRGEPMTVQFRNLRLKSL